MTPEQAKQKFRDSGKSVAEWADHHKFNRSTVYRVLNGRTPCWRGEPHRVAVALGIKQGA